MPTSQLIDRIIEQLRGPALERFPFYGNNGRSLADYLEKWTLGQFDDAPAVPWTGRDDEDRAALADWLVEAARLPPYCSPSWGRNFSEIVAWLVRHGHDISFESVIVAMSARRNPELTRLANESGMETAYAWVEQRAAERAR